MTYKEINKTALNLNKSKYISALVVKLFFFLIIGIMTVLILFSDRYLTTKLLKTENEVIYSSVRISVFAIITLLSHIFYSGFSLGETAVYSGRINRKRSSLKRIIYWLKPTKSLKAFYLNIIVSALKALWASVFLLPGVTILLTILYLAFTGGIEVYLLISLAVSSLALIITGIVFSFVISQRYFLAKFLLAENPKLKIIQVIRQSKNLMEYQLMTVVKFKLCFVLPFMLSVFIFPIIFLYPHYKQGLSIVAKELTI